MMNRQQNHGSKGNSPCLGTNQIRGPDLPKWSKKVMWGTTIVSVGWQLLKLALAPTPRLCPKCSYRMVLPVGKRFQRKRMEERWSFDTITLWLCTACKRQYETTGDGPFREPAQNPSRRKTATNKVGS